MTHTIGVIGVGGVGGYFGGKLTALISTQSADVYFVARGQHLAAIQEQGLLLSTDEGDCVCKPTLATDRVAALPQLDICLVCVKSYDLRAVLAQLQPKLHEKSIILPLLNGVDIYDRVKEAIPSAAVLPACVYIGTHIEAAGKVTQRGGACTILMGPDPRAPERVLQPLFIALADSGIKYQWFDDVAPAIWTKYLFIAAFGLVGAAYDKTLGQIVQSPHLNGLVQSVMGEIEAIAKKKHIALPDTIVADSLKKGGQFAFETKTSFQRDVEQRDKPDERDLFSDTIIGLGTALGIDTPITQSLSLRINQIKGSIHSSRSRL